MSQVAPAVAIALLLAIAIGFFMFSKRNASKHVWETTPGGPYELIVSETGILCRHPQRPEEYISFKDIKEIHLVTTSDGPFLPDMWYLFIGESTGCSVPSEAKGFDELWDIFKQRFPGFDYSPILEAGTDNSERVLWRKAEQDAAANP